MYVNDDVVISGRRLSDRPGDIQVTFGDGQELVHVQHHSTDSFEWGYGGSGPADLALSILELAIASEPRTVKLWHSYCSETAWRLHQQFKREWVAGWCNEWHITIGAVRQWIAAHPEEVTDAPTAAGE